MLNGYFLLKILKNEKHKLKNETIIKKFHSLKIEKLRQESLSGFGQIK